MPCVEGLTILKDEKFPVVFYSHGLAGMRTTYSQICCNLASRGFIVIAIEHADGSACYTSRLDAKIEFPYQRPNEKDMQETEVVQEYLLRFRTKQLTHRKNEVQMAYELIQKVNAGDFKSLHKPDNGKQIQQLAGKFDLENAVLMGHSFGGATSIEVLHADQLPFKCAVILDPWMFAVNPDAKVRIPALNLQSHNFHWRQNLEQIEKLISDPEYHSKSVFGYLTDTKHNDASDFGLFWPWLMNIANQSGPKEPSITMSVLDQTIFDFVSNFVRHPSHGSDGVSFDTVGHVVQGEAAMTELYSAMKK